MHRALVLLTVALGALLGTALPAAATTVDEIVAGLREDPLYVSQESSVTPDQAVVREALSRTRVPTYVVMVPQAAADAEELGIDGLTLKVLEGLAQPEAVLVVITDGQELQAAEGGASGVDASGLLDAVLAARLDQPFGPATLTGALVDYARMVDEGADAGPADGGSTRRTVGLVGLVAVAALGGGGWLYARSLRRLAVEAPLTFDDDEEEHGWHSATTGSPQPES